VAFTELRHRWQDVSLQDLIAQYDEGDFTPAALTDPASTPEQQTVQQMMLAIVQRLTAEELNVNRPLYASQDGSCPPSCRNSSSVIWRTSVSCRCVSRVSTMIHDASRVATRLCQVPRRTL